MSAARLAAARIPAFAGKTLQYLIAEYGARPVQHQPEGNCKDMDYVTCRSLPAMFFDAAKRRGDRPFLWAKRHRIYRPLSWSDTAGQVMNLARGLISLGIAPGDRVALVAESRPEWVVADLAIMSSGAITVPVYTTNTADDHRHILGNSGARAAIVSTPSLAARLIPAAEQTPGVQAVIAIEPLGHTLGRTPSSSSRAL